SGMRCLFCGPAGCSFLKWAWARTARSKRFSNVRAPMRTSASCTTKGGKAAWLRREKARELSRGDLARWHARRACGQGRSQGIPCRDSRGPTLWLCKRDGIVVGQQASIPVMLKVGDLQYRAAWGMDLMVRTEWRLRGVAPALSAAYEDSAEITLGAAMSEAA